MFCFVTITTLVNLTSLASAQSPYLPPSPVFLNVHGEYLDAAEAGQQIMIMKIIENREEFEQPFVALLEVRDSNDTSQYIAWQRGILPISDVDNNRLAEATIGFSWSANVPSTYQARVYVIDSFDHPNILQAIASAEIVVIDSSAE